MDTQLFEATQRLREWCHAKPFVRRLWLFGSRLRGTHRDDSDLDVALEIDPLPKDEDVLTSWISESSAWETELRAIVPYQVDLQLYDLDDARSVVVGYVKCCGMLLYARAA